MNATAADRQAAGSRWRGLPAQLTSFVGREREVAEVRGLLRAMRVVRLTGTGGVGKTRLALEAARRCAADYVAGVKLVELAPLADPALVPQAVALAVDVEDPGGSLLETLLDALGERALLLVLDNCEHLVQACAELCDAILRACPGVHILATSREPLRLPGEAVWRVPSLSLPALDVKVSIEKLGRSEAVRLFVERAHLARPGFKLTPDNAAGMAQICQQLDGMPLAIELAAARVSALSVEQIATHLDNSLGLLTGGSRTAQARQRTLRGTLDWSYGMLSEAEQTLLAQLAVFAGGWSLEAAEAVCSSGASERVVELLINLVNKSLVTADERGRATRYRLLDTVRQYAWEKLRRDVRSEVTVRGHHRDWYLQLAERFDLDWRSPRQKAWLEELECEQANLRAALRWCVNRSEVTEGLRLAGALCRFWEIRGHLGEGRAWLAELLPMADRSVSDQVRAGALYADGFLALYQGDAVEADAKLQQALALWRALGEGERAAYTLASIGVVAKVRGDEERHRATIAESLALARRLGDRVGTYIALFNSAIIPVHPGDLARGRALHEESLSLKRQQGDTYAIAFSLLGLAELALMQGEQENATTLLRESLVLSADLRHRRGIAGGLELAAEIGGASGQARRAARLYGAAQAQREAYGGSGVLLRPGLGDAVDRVRQAENLAMVRARLTPAAFDAAWAEGHAMSLEDAVACALVADDTAFVIDTPAVTG